MSNGAGILPNSQKILVGEMSAPVSKHNVGFEQVLRSTRNSAATGSAVRTIPLLRRTATMEFSNSTIFIIASQGPFNYIDSE